MYESNRWKCLNDVHERLVSPRGATAGDFDELRKEYPGHADVISDVQKHYTPDMYIDGDELSQLLKSYGDRYPVDSLSKLSVVSWYRRNIIDAEGVEGIAVASIPAEHIGDLDPDVRIQVVGRLGDLAMGLDRWAMAKIVRPEVAQYISRDRWEEIGRAILTSYFKGMILSGEDEDGALSLITQAAPYIRGTIERHSRAPLRAEIGEAVGYINPPNTKYHTTAELGDIEVLNYESMFETFNAVYNLFNVPSKEEMEVRAEGARRVLSGVLSSLKDDEEGKDSMQSSPSITGAGSFEGMIYLPELMFEMGYRYCHGDSDSGDLIPSFYLDEHEVTNAEYSAYHPSPSPKGFDGSNQPVVNVNWYEADAYCKSQGKRLPTEREWERAAACVRTDRTMWDGTPVFLFGGSHDKDNADGSTADVCSYEKSEPGLCDMLGNVWEWASDWDDEVFKVVRGGSWRSCWCKVMSVGRDGYLPTLRDNDVGFRCAASPVSR